MWLLHYEYVDEAGEQCRKLQIIKITKEYSVGRSVKCTCKIQNDKSISRVHLIIKYDGSDLIVINKGKLTKLADQLVPLEEKFVLHKQDMTFSIGVAPLNVNFRYMYEEWKIPHGMALNEKQQAVSGFGVKLSDSFTKRTTLQIFSDDRSYSGCLFALLKGVPVVSIPFLSEIGNLFEHGDNVDFIPVFRRLKEKYALFPEYKYEANALRGLTILVLAQKVYDTLRYTIAVGGGEIKLLNNSSQVDEFLSSNSGPVCVLSSSCFYYPNESARVSKDLDLSIRDILLRYEIEVLNINEFTYMLTNNKIKDLRKRKIVSISKPAPTFQKHTEITAGEPAKQKKSKPKIQSLDSLSYFGGGEPVVKRESFNEQSMLLPSNTEATFNERSQNSISINSTEDVRTNLANYQPAPAETVVELPSKSSGFAEPAEPKKISLNRNISNVNSKKRRRPAVLQLENLMMRGSSQTAGDSKIETHSETVHEPKPNEDLPEVGSIIASWSNSVGNEVQPAQIAILSRRSINDTSIQNKNTDEGTTLLPSSREEERVPKEVLSDRDITPKESTQHVNSLVNSNSRPQSTALLQTELPSKDSSNMVNAIAETKQREVKRFEEGMIEIHESELTKSALDDFKDVVKVNTVKIKPRVIPSMTVIDRSSIGLNRKNFKRFKKNWPTYRKFSVNLSCETVSSEKNREYVKLLKYENGHPSKSNSEDKMENVAANHPPEDGRARSRDRSEAAEDIEPDKGFRFSIREGSTSATSATSLFVPDDDDVNELSLQSSNFANSADNLRPSSASNHLEEDDDDDDDDTPRFNFRSRRNV
ncbi:unnamed protein product [Kluyveromyces dobzhanskii CBS 2104]|uniref:WGS project CCBQ000000000 data, contig 00106 n=1 Tax=Kluyveromyces dobzhanskii CBS 2104 TaxID=1427455 RepID=A0A0A8L5Q2_9SACH|nr:unnamed protein product [Kluyveromyces dobzhanskii CBS 2104]